MSRPPTLRKKCLHAPPVEQHVAPRLGPLDVPGPAMLLEQALGKRIQLGQLRGPEPVSTGPVAVGEKGHYLFPDDGTQLANGKRHHQSAFVYVPFSHDSPNDFDLLHHLLRLPAPRNLHLDVGAMPIAPPGTWLRYLFFHYPYASYLPKDILEAAAVVS